MNKEHMKQFTNWLTNGENSDGTVTIVEADEDGPKENPWHVPGGESLQHESTHSWIVLKHKYPWYKRLWRAFQKHILRRNPDKFEVRLIINKGDDPEAQI